MLTHYNKSHWYSVHPACAVLHALQNICSCSEHAQLSDCCSHTQKACDTLAQRHTQFCAQCTSLTLCMHNSAAHVPYTLPCTQTLTHICVRCFVAQVHYTIACVQCQAHAHAAQAQSKRTQHTLPCTALTHTLREKLCGAGT